MHNKYYYFAARISAIFIPASVILYFAVHTGILPDNDYWGILNPILTDNGFSHKLASWLSRANEHVITIPKVLFAVNILLTGGNNTGLALIAWSAALIQVLLLILVIPTDIRKDPVRGTVLLLIISIFIFTPKAAHNWIMGMSGTMWMTANMFSVAAIALIYRFHSTGRHLCLWGGIASGLLAGFCYSTPLALWPALILGAFLLRFRPRHIFIIIAAATVAYVFYFARYVHPPYHPSAENSPYKVGLFLLNFLGGLFINGPEYARFGMSLALVGIALSFLAVWLRSGKGGAWREESAPWLMLQLYAVGNGVLSGISRAGFGMDMALSSRYASLPAFFWLGLCAMWLIYFWRTERLRLYLPLPSAVIAVLISQMYMTSFNNVGMLLSKGTRKEVATVSLITGLYDELIIKETLTPAPEQLMLVMDRLQRIGHVPFNKWPEGWPHLGEKFDLKQLPVRDEKQYFGFFDEIAPFSSGMAKVRGWSYVPNEEISCVAIVNNDGVVRGLASPGISRPDVATALNMSNQTTGWEGYTQLIGGDQGLRVCVLVENSGQWYRLGQSLAIPHQPTNLTKD